MNNYVAQHLTGAYMCLLNSAFGGWGSAQAWEELATNGFDSVKDRV